MTLAVQDYLKDLETLVNTESFSRDPEGTAQVAAWIRRRLEGAGWHTETISVGDQVGPCVKAVWGNPDHYAGAHGYSVPQRHRKGPSFFH